MIKFTEMTADEWINEDTGIDKDRLFRMMLLADLIDYKNCFFKGGELDGAKS
jgi:hypothetical protein